MVDPLNPGNTMRMFGLASGLDIDSMVQKLMTAERIPLDQMTQQRQVLQWKQDDYRSMNSLLLDLYNSTFDMTLQSSYMAKTATSTNEDLVSATAGSGASNATYTLENVTLAKAATAQSSGAIVVSGVTDFDPTQSLWDMRGKLNNLTFSDAPPITGEKITVNTDKTTTVNLANGLIDNTQAFSIDVNGTVYHANFNQTDYDNDTSANKVLVNTTTGKVTFNNQLALNSVVTVNYTHGIGSTPTAVSGETLTTSSSGTVFNLQHGNLDTSVLPTVSVGNTAYKVYTDKSQYDADKTSANKVYVNSSTGQMTFNNSIAQGSTITSNYTYKKGIINYTLKAADDSGTMQSYDFDFTPASSLNDILNSMNKSDADVSMFYDSSTQKISVVRDKTGDFNSSVSDIDFGSNNFLTNTLGLSTVQEGNDAKVTINGLATTRHTNTFTINDVTFTLKDNTTTGQKVTVSVSGDTDTVFNKIKDWVDKYNDTIKKVNDKLAEKRYRDYPPLTDTQKKDMKDSDIELWNQKAMSGMLSGDQLLPSGLDQMRMDIYSTVTSVSDTAYNQLADIGITTSSDYTENGKLVIDETKLKAAIAANPDAVMDLLTKSSDNYDEKGIMQRVHDTLNDTMNNIYQEAGKDSYTYDQFYLGKSIHDFDGQISDMQSHLNDVQNRYYTQFTAMEQAIQQANQQGSFISSNFGG